MDPDRAALLDALERQLYQLRRVRERLASTPRVTPGTSTFWSGPARAAYELMVTAQHDALRGADDALQAAIAATSRAIGTMRHG